MADYVQVTTATESLAAARELASGVITSRLAAGAQIDGPITSLFWHLGESGQGEEWRITFKTTLELYPSLESHLIENHPWTNPEVVATPILAGSDGYLQWISRTTEPQG